LLATGQFVTAFPRSVLHLYADRFSLKALPLDLPVQPWPVRLLTQKNRTLSPLVERSRGLLYADERTSSGCSGMSAIWRHYPPRDARHLTCYVHAVATPFGSPLKRGVDFGSLKPSLSAEST